MVAAAAVEPAQDQVVPQLAADAGEDAVKCTVQVAEEWEILPYGELSDMLAYTMEAAEAALKKALAQEARAAELATALAPGGEIEQPVAARGNQVEAIVDIRTADARVGRSTGLEVALGIQVAELARS